MEDNMMEWRIQDAKEQVSPGSVMMDGWELKELFGQGGFGDVWRAEKKLAGIADYSAIKIIRIPRDPAEIKAMRAEGFSISHIRSELRRSVENAVREIRTMIELRSCPAIVPCENFNVIQYEDDESWEIDIRMQLLKPLPDWAKTTDVKPEDVIRMGISLSNLLSVCETKGILHRDIKPSNIFVDQIGNFKLGDFGLARIISGSGSTHSKGVGTEAFMAPEVFAGKKYDHRADIYSLGLVMYWLLNCQSLPFTNVSTSRNQAITRRLSGEPIPALSGVNPELDKIVRKACEKDPKKRWKTAKEFHDALVDFRNRQDLPHSRKPTKSSHWIIILAVLTVIALFTCGYLVYRTMNPGDKEYNTAETIVLLDQANKAKDEALAQVEELTKAKEEALAQVESLKAAAEESARKAAEEEAARKAAEEEAARKAAEEEAARKAAEEEAARKAAEEEAARKAAEEEAARKAAEEEAARKAAEEEAARKAVVVGNYVTFGTYPQTASGDDSTPIEWLVLARDGQKALLISRYGLDAQPYGEHYDDWWPTCSLRTWLNSTFLNKAFSSAEQAAILPTDVDQSDTYLNQKLDSWSGQAVITQDRIFLLSYAEANRYFAVLKNTEYNIESRVAPTAYAENIRGRLTDGYKTADGDESMSWWLRSSEAFSSKALCVCYTGYLIDLYKWVTIAVRPAMWINLDLISSDLYSIANNND